MNEEAVVLLSFSHQSVCAYLAGWKGLRDFAQTKRELPHFN